MFQANIRVTFKRTILDPQGTAVGHALASLGYDNVRDVRIGKLITLKIDADSKERAEREIKEMCGKLLANPVIEDFEFTLSEGKDSK